MPLHQAVHERDPDEGLYIHSRQRLSKIILRELRPPESAPVERASALAKVSPSGCTLTTTTVTTVSYAVRHLAAEHAIPLRGVIQVHRSALRSVLQQQECLLNSSKIHHNCPKGDGRLSRAARQASHTERSVWAPLTNPAYGQRGTPACSAFAHRANAYSAMRRAGLP